MITRRQLEAFVNSVVRPFKGRRREQAAFAIAALCFSGGWALGNKIFPDISNAGGWKGILQLSLYAVGIVSLLYGALRVWRLVQPIELPPTKNRPLAIKGPMPFTEADGELFRRLGRERELQKLLGLVLDDQVLMVVVRGASGAGKTSLLRAGLRHILGDRAILHYWEAVPTDPEKGLLRALHEKWPEDSAKPASLDELVNPANELGRHSHVVVIDQFEQLRGGKKILRLLRRVVRESKPPHRITWVIAFRREFSADWMDFVGSAIGRDIHPPQDVSLKLFTASQALDVISQLVDESHLKDSIEQKVIDRLVEATKVEGEVSPVDIGIGLLVLAELHERNAGETLTVRDYQFAGGADGLLTQYITRCLELFPRESQEGILKAMLALRDPEQTSQRLAQGATIEELAAEAGTDARVLQPHFNRLADRDIRLLETYTAVDGSDIRYRLPHERLISALNRLTGKLSAEVDQAKMRFQNTFQGWKINDKRSRYLLKAKDLRLIEKYETQIPWGIDEEDKKTFLYASKQRRQRIRIGVAAATAIVATGIWIANNRYQRYEHERYLFESGYPRELYSWQPQLKKLGMIGSLDLERFKWLSSHSVQELELHVLGSSNSLSGLTSLSKCHRLKKLTLDLGGSQVMDIDPVGQLNSLTDLTLNLKNSQVSDLTPLESLKEMRQLTLDLSSSPPLDLKPLEQLKQLSQLTLDLQSSAVNDLKPLEQLSGLTQLTLRLDSTNISDLKPLGQLRSLTQLSLILGSSKVTDLTPLMGLTNLKELSLILGSSPVADLTPLQNLTSLSQLSLDLSFSNVSDLKPLAQLKRLSYLSLNLCTSLVTDLTPLEQLQGLPQVVLKLTEVNGLKSLEQFNRLTLTLVLSDSEMKDLKPLERLKGLTQLTLDLRESKVTDLSPLEQLTGISQLELDLSSSPVSDLNPLKQLTRLSILSLNLPPGQFGDLKPLEQLKGLTQLSLDLGSNKVSDLKPLEQLAGLTQLSLDLSHSHVSDLKSLKQLKMLKQLTLQLQGKKGGRSRVRDLEVLGSLPLLESLSLETATEQRKSLKKIPASLAELKF